MEYMCFCVVSHTMSYLVCVCVCACVGERCHITVTPDPPSEDTFNKGGVTGCGVTSSTELGEPVVDYAAMGNNALEMMENVFGGMFYEWVGKKR